MPFRRQVVIATKFGFDCDSGKQGGLDGTGFMAQAAILPGK